MAHALLLIITYWYGTTNQYQMFFLGLFLGTDVQATIMCVFVRLAIY